MATINDGKPTGKVERRNLADLGRKTWQRDVNVAPNGAISIPGEESVHILTNAYLAAIREELEASRKVFRDLFGEVLSELRAISRKLNAKPTEVVPTAEDREKEAKASRERMSRVRAASAYLKTGGPLADEIRGKVNVRNEGEERYLINDETKLDYCRDLLPFRVRNCLHGEGIETVGQLRRITSDELLQIRNFGVTSLLQVRKFLWKNGFDLLEGSSLDETDAGR